MNNTKEDVEKMIFDHLQENPNSSDTLEGITEWWLDLVKIDRSVDVVANALESLINKGIVGKKCNKDGKLIYYKRL